MNTHYLSFFGRLFFLLSMFSIGCGEEHDVSVVDNDQSDENKETFKNPPLFDSGGSSSPEYVGPIHFCQMYLAADAFIFGSIIALEMTEDPFVVIDPDTGVPDNTLSVQSIDECFSVTPSLKMTIETSAFITNYEEIEREAYIHLYIGPYEMDSMNPSPTSDIAWDTDIDSKKRIKTSEVYWERDRCETGGPCPLEVGQQVGFFARYDKSLNFWYMSESTFWANSTEGSLTPSLYENINNKRSLMEIEDSTEECKDFTSTAADHYRSEPIRTQKSNYSRPQCRFY